MAIKKGVHIIKGLGRGGAERLLVSTIRNSGPDWSWDVIYFLSSRDAMVPDLEALGCKVTCLPSVGIAGMWLRLPQLVRLIRKGKFDLIHAHLPWSGIIARFTGLITGRPVIYTEHNLFSHYKRLTRFFNYLTYRLQKQVIAVSDQVAASIPESLLQTVPVSVINNGVDLLEFDSDLFHREAILRKSGIHSNAFVVGIVASIRPQKRIDRWLSIAESVLAQNNRIHFLLVGGGTDLSEIRRQVLAMPHHDRIHITGLQPEPAIWYAMMNVFLMTSDYEGMPVALLEAMAMGCVPVTTAVGGISSVVTDGHNGFLFSGEKHETATEQILRLSLNEQLYQQMAQAARQTMEQRFNVRYMVAQQEVIYDQMIQQHKLSGQQKH